MRAKDCTGREIHLGDWVVENPFYATRGNTFLVTKECRVSALQQDGCVWFLETTDCDGNKAQARADKMKIVDGKRLGE